jgi:hypothetical protein
MYILILWMFNLPPASPIRYTAGGGGAGGSTLSTHDKTRPTTPADALAGIYVFQKHTESSAGGVDAYGVETTWVPGGHVTSFFTQHDTFRRKITEALSRMRQ